MRFGPRIGREAEGAATEGAATEGAPTQVRAKASTDNRRRPIFTASVRWFFLCIFDEGP